MKRKSVISCALLLSGLLAIASLSGIVPGTLRIGGSKPTLAPSRVAAARTVPFKMTPSEADWNECTHIDNNQLTWGRLLQGVEGFTITYFPEVDLDNWIFTPAISLQPGQYKFSCQYKTRTRPENFSIYLVTSPNEAPSSRVMTLLDLTEYQNSEFSDLEVPVEITTAGNYYIALYASTPAGNHGIQIRNVALNSADSRMPQLPVIGTPVIEGLHASIPVTLPTKTDGGADLDGTVGLDVKIDGLATTYSGTPGQTITIDGDYSIGRHKIECASYVMADGVKLASEWVSAYFDTHRVRPESMTIPFTIAPDSDEFSWCNMLDVNDDNHTWTYSDGAFVSAINTLRAADDWLILPIINFPAQGLYQVEYEVMTGTKNESLQVATATVGARAELVAGVQASFEEFHTNGAWVTQTVNIQINKAGLQFIGFRACSPADRDRIRLRNITVTQGDNMKPMKPSIGSIDLTDGTGSIAVTLPAKNYGGETLTGQLSASLLIDGAPVATLSGTPGQTLTFPVKNLAEGFHTASAYAINIADGKTRYSETVSTDFRVVMSENMTYHLPLNIRLDAVWDDLTFVNNSANEWKRSSGYITSSYTGSYESDNWAFTLPIELTADNIDYMLNFALDAKSEFAFGNESFEVWIGTAAKPEAMTQQLVDATTIARKEYTTFTDEFALSEPGNYVIGIHVTSGKNASSLYFSNLSLTNSTTPSTAPAVATNISTEGDPTGAIKGTVYFRFPTLTARGSELAADETLTATAVCGEHTATTTGLPGSEAFIDIDCMEVGANTVLLTCSNQYGQGLATEAVINCGLDIPSVPRVLTTEVSADNRTMSIRWRAVTTGENDGIVNPEAMRYNIYLLDYSQNANGEWVKLADTDKLTYELTVPDFIDYLDTYYIGIEAYNGPDSKSKSMAVTHAVLGKPYELPITEHFTGGQLSYGPISLYSAQAQGYSPTWQVSDPSQLNSAAACSDGAALIGHTNYTSGQTQIEFPKFTTDVDSDPNADSIIAEFDFYLDPSYTPDVTFVALTELGESYPVDLGTLDTSKGQGWTKIEVAIPAELLNKQWIAVRAVVDFNRGNNDWALLDRYAMVKKNTLSVESIEGTNGITATRGAITLRGYEGKQAIIANAEGRVMANARIASQQHSIALPGGIYLVTIGGNTTKVLVP